MKSARIAWEAAGLSLVLMLTSLPALATDEPPSGNEKLSVRFSDPLETPPVPPWAVGQAHRAPNLDVLPGFQKPPPGFGVVPFFWWLGDPLTKDRLSWILDQMQGLGISGYQINYAHGYHDGGISYGLTMPSEPPLFSDKWWDLTRWFMQEAKRQGAAISLSDYTLGIGQGWWMDEILREHPDMCGQHLRMVEGRAANALTTASLTNADGTSRVVSVVAETVPLSLDPMHPQSGAVYAAKFFGQFEAHFPGEAGKGLNFFFSDELGFGVDGLLWNDRFRAEFLKRKGYDIVPELPALFVDTGPRTPKLRLDYCDLRTSLSEEGFFRPVFEWHQQRGMTMGCDHGGRGMNLTEFGDYFRTQRWNQGPGSDQPGLGKNLIKAKVAASIAHLYQRPRVWLEGYYGSGWGTTSAGIVDATFANYAMGYNLLSFHGMYYSTHGGWWEWAPPDNTFRMPYWKHLGGFMDCVQRLSYLLSQGHHQCDVAILYPVAPVEAGMDGQAAVDAAFAAASLLYGKSVDFDFIDFQSLARSQVADKELRVAGERYRVLILPAMKAVRHATLQKALAFRRSGGTVLALGALPEASDRIGRNDPELAAMLTELFPHGPTRDLLNDVLNPVPVRDYAGPGYIQHRKLGMRDLYAVYNAPKDAEVAFRATGKVELWDPWTGSVRFLAVTSQTETQTSLRLPLSQTEIQLIVFTPGSADMAPAAAESKPVSIPVDGDWEFELQPTCDNRFGDFHWPPTPGLIGPEARRIWYCEGEGTNGPWHQVTCSFGPGFIRTSSMPDGKTAPKDGKPYSFSWRWGVEGDPGLQGYHGLKELVHDEFITIGSMKRAHADSEYQADESHPYFWTTVSAPREMTVYAHVGQIPPARVWLNGAEVAGTTLPLKPGPNPLVLFYDKSKPGRTYYVVSTSQPVETAQPPRRLPPGEQPKFQEHPLAMRWSKDPGLLPFDVRPDEKVAVGWYRVISPPGLRGLEVHASGKVTAWVDGELAEPVTNGLFRVRQGLIFPPAVLLLRIEQERGFYGGATLLEPIRFDCGQGLWSLGDWSKNETLTNYSGGAWYRKTVQIPAARRVRLDLGIVAASAEARVNGTPLGVRVSAPWIFDASKVVRPGENRIEVLVFNTLANHYTTVPTAYRGSTVSGLLGPVQVLIDP